MSHPFKILHLSTGSSGGAGIAARRLSEALCEYGLDSQFISLQRKNFIPGPNEIGIQRSLISRFISAIFVRVNSVISTRIPFSIFSWNAYDYKRLSKLGLPSNTILHIHNWYNLINFREISKLSNLGYKIVFTMHDQRVFTGGCHTAYACVGFHSNCKTCPHVSSLVSKIPSMNLRHMIKNGKGFLKRAIFIAPSYWIQHEARKSNLLKDMRIEFIPNTLHSHFLYLNARRNFKFNSGHIYLGVASVDRKSFIKGGETVELLQKYFMANKLKISFIYLSDSTVQQDPIQFFWHKIDFLFVPSKIDNSPNVIHEAKRIGLPVIATKVGGITELLDEEFDVPLEENFDFSLLVKSLQEYYSLSDYEKRRLKMQKNFNLYVDNVIERHVRVYNEIFYDKT